MNKRKSFLIIIIPAVIIGEVLGFYVTYRDHRSVAMSAIAVGITMIFCGVVIAFRLKGLKKEEELIKQEEKEERNKQIK